MIQQKGCLIAVELAVYQNTGNSAFDDFQPHRTGIDLLRGHIYRGQRVSLLAVKALQIIRRLV